MDNSALKARADELLGELNHLRSGIGELQRKLRAVTATVTSDDGMVTATVGPRGQLQSTRARPAPLPAARFAHLADTITKTGAGGGREGAGAGGGGVPAVHAGGRHPEPPQPRLRRA